VNKIVVPILAVLSLAACGGGESESEREAEAERSEAFAPICELNAMSGDTGLPTDFPTIGAITFVKAEKAGPSRVVEGYGDGELEELYNELHDAFESSDYKITFDEREEHDAEISFEGSGQSGQVKFADECGQEGRVYVRVTARPTG